MVTGDVTLPLLAALVVCAASIAALVAAARRAQLAAYETGSPPAPGETSVPHRDPVAAVAAAPALIALALILAANIVVIGDGARLLGIARVNGILAAAVLAVAIVAGTSLAARLPRRASLGAAVVAPLGLALVLAPLAVVVMTNGAPWTIWRDLASRPALTFATTSRWVTQGAALADGARLKFDEPHRVIAATPATWHVLERDAARTVVREWRLGAGDALTVRPGDELAIDPGAKVRFEAGRRVPGAPASGTSWASGLRGSSREMVVALGGLGVTLVAGGVALAPATGAGVTALCAPVLALAFVLGAILWGLYAAALAPELALVPRALAPIVEVVQRVEPPMWRAVLAVTIAAGVIALFAALVVAWHGRATDAIACATPSPMARSTTVFALVPLAAAIAWRGGDPWQLFTWGLGLLAAAVVAPRLASAGARGEVAGTLVGTLAFAALAFGAARIVPYPALIAAPLAWAAARATLARS